MTFSLQVGERIRVILDCEDNTLAFEKNYEFLGMYTLQKMVVQCNSKVWIPENSHESDFCMFGIRDRLLVFMVQV